MPRGAIVAFGALKGGAGKSSLAVNVGASLAVRGLRVELVDADEQGSALEWSRADAGEGRPGLPMRVHPLPASEGIDERQWLDALLERAAPVEILLLDLPPQLGGVMRAALAAAELVVVPVTPSGVDLASTARVLDLVREAREIRGDGRPRCLLVPSRVDRRTAAGREIEASLHGFGEPVGPAISQRSAHVDAFGAGAWIGQFAPRSAAHVEIETLVSLIRKVVSRETKTPRS